MLLCTLRRDYEKKILSSYYVYYAVIVTKIYNFIPALRVLRVDHDKKILFFISVLRSIRRNCGRKKFTIATTSTTFEIMTNIVFLCCYDVRCALIITENMYFYFHTAFTTSWLRKNIFYFTFQHYVHNALITTENTFIFIPTLGSLHDKFSISVRFVDLIVISPSGNLVSVSIRFVDVTIILPSGISVESHNISD